MTTTDKMVESERSRPDACIQRTFDVDLLLAAIRKLPRYGDVVRPDLVRRYRADFWRKNVRKEPELGVRRLGLHIVEVGAQFPAVTDGQDFQRHRADLVQQPLDKTRCGLLGNLHGLVGHDCLRVGIS